MPPSLASPTSPTKKGFHCFPSTQVPLGALLAQNPFPCPLITAVAQTRSCPCLILYCEPITRPLSLSVFVAHISDNFPSAPRPGIGPSQASQTHGKNDWVGATCVRGSEPVRFSSGTSELRELLRVPDREKTSARAGLLGNGGTQRKESH